MSRALKHVMPVRVGFNWIILEAECTQLLHIGDTEARAHMNPGSVSPAAALNFRPGLRGKLRNGLVRLAPHRDLTIHFAQSSAWSCRRVRPDGNFHRPTLQFGKPFLRDTQL